MAKQKLPQPGEKGFNIADHELSDKDRKETWEEAKQLTLVLRGALMGGPQDGEKYIDMSGILYIFGLLEDKMYELNMDNGARAMKHHASKLK
jgi:hypothetical protein